MWTHDCPSERTCMEVGAGEECNWCGATEEIKMYIARPGQSYVDEPVVVKPKLLPTLMDAVIRAFGRPPQRRDIVIGFARTHLRWVTR